MTFTQLIIINNTIHKFMLEKKHYCSLLNLRKVSNLIGDIMVRRTWCVFIALIPLNSVYAFGNKMLELSCFNFRQFNSNVCFISKSLFSSRNCNLHHIKIRTRNSFVVFYIVTYFSQTFYEYLMVETIRRHKTTTGFEFEVLHENFYCKNLLSIGRVNQVKGNISFCPAYEWRKIEKYSTGLVFTPTNNCIPNSCKKFIFAVNSK